MAVLILGEALKPKKMKVSSNARVLAVLMFNNYAKSFIKGGSADYIVNRNIDDDGDLMPSSQVVERAREKAQEVVEKTGETISKGLTEGWGKAKGLGRDLKNELSRVHRKKARNKTSRKRRKPKGDKR